MKCLDCQHALIKIPTSQGPDLDVCSNGHGLWLDAGEVNLFVEDYAALERDAGPECSAAVCTEALCPRFI